MTFENRFLQNGMIFIANYTYRVVFGDIEIDKWPNRKITKFQ